MVTSTRGQKGGYILAVPAHMLTIDMIFEAIEEPLQITRCSSTLETKGCQGASTRCAVHHLWKNLEDHISDYLGKKTLADLCDSPTPAQEQLRLCEEVSL